MLEAREIARQGLGGLSNSLPKDSYCPPGSEFVPRVGVDTISWGWSDPGSVDRLLRLDGLVPKGERRPLSVVPSPGGAVRLSRRLDGLGTVGAFPGASLLFVEGRARALERANEDDHGLGRARTLPVVQDQVTDQLGRLLGRAPQSVAQLRRIDLAGELQYDRGEDGRQILAILDGLHSPNYKTSPVRERGGPGLETVYWRTPKRSVPVLRAYDKGVESGSAPIGERIRIERQVRYRGGTRPELRQFLAGDIADLYIRPIRAWFRGGIAAGTAEELIRLLTDAAVIWPTYWSSGSCWFSRTGTVHISLWSPRKVERVIGTLGIVAAYGRAWPAWSSKQRQRRLAEIRELGLLLLDEPVRVDVDHAVNSLCDLWRMAA